MVDDEKGNYCGFIMPELSINAELGEVYRYPSTSKDSYAKTPLPTFKQETDNFALAIHILVFEKA